MKIGIVGFGVLGKALYEGFQDKSHIVFINDIKDVDTEFQEDHMTKDEMMVECQVIFICVDTPPRDDNGGCDLTKVYEVFNQLHIAWGELSRTEEGLRVTQKQPIIAIKSTVIPGTLDTLNSAYPWSCSNPEFIRQSSALEDFLNPDRIVIGAHKKAVIETMKELYKDFDCPILITTPIEAEMIKYFSNAFLILKVAFSQELQYMSEKMIGVRPDAVMEGVYMDHRIHKSHLRPCGGKIPYHSPCLVKDLRAIIQASEMSGYDPWLLKAAYITGVAGAGFKLKMEVTG